MLRNVLLILAFSYSVSEITAQGYGTLNINDARMRMYPNGLIGPGPENIGPVFLVPSADGTSPLYSSGLWLSGRAPDQSAVVAAHMFGSGGQRDFFPGPLTIDGSATINSTVSELYDQVWTVERADVILHRAYFRCAGDPDCDLSDEFPNGYAPPPSFISWPAHGDADNGQDLYLAPFVDYDNDGYYDPWAGDHPCVPGDQALFTIFNDKLDLHSESGGEPLGIEVHMMPFAFSGDPVLAQTVFVHYRIFNRSDRVIHDLMIGQFADLDLGCSSDDFIGTDAARGMVYVYNANDPDSGCTSGGYGAQPPAFGMVMLKGPLMDADGLDNAELFSENFLYGTQFDDGMIDNERFGLSGSIAWPRDGSASLNDPPTAFHFHHRLRSAWSSTQPMIYGGNGYSADPNAIPCRYIFPGDTDPLGLGTGGNPQDPWTEASAGIEPGDMRALASTGAITFEPGEEVDLLIAFVYSRAANGGAQASVAALQHRVDSLRNMVDDIPDLLDLSLGSAVDCYELFTTIQEPFSNQELVIQPNPVMDALIIRSQGLFSSVGLSILDLSGRVVLADRMTGPYHQVDVTALSPAVYILRVEGNKSIRFVKE